MLKGNTLTIYIHNKAAVPKSRPLTAKCQLMSIAPQNSRVHPKGGIHCKASFRNTWALASNRLWRMAYGIIRNIIQWL